MFGIEYKRFQLKSYYGKSDLAHSKALLFAFELNGHMKHYVDREHS